MYVSIILLLSLWGEAALSHQLRDDRADAKESTVVDKRLDTLERLLLDQMAHNAQQDTLFRQQNARLSYQESRLRHQQSLLRQQHAKLSHQEALLSQYGQLIEQLKFSQVDNHSELTNTPTIHNAQSGTDGGIPHWDNITVAIPPLPDTPGSGDAVVSVKHEVRSRSDDAGPLEVVVGQISQHVTGMDADIQAFKTQTASDFQTTRTEMQTMRTETTSEIQALKNSNTEQDQAIQDARSSIFVHWGSSQCANSSELVYSGVVGGSIFQHTGAATNYLCLTLSPIFSNHQIPLERAYLYGGEYETYDSHTDKDPVCSVCRATFSTTVMIPGTNVCTPGWRLLYSGFLMAGREAHVAASEYVCVDSKLENRMSGDTNLNGKLLFYTVTQCGSLPCTPYVNNKIVTCAVCGK